MGTYQVGSAVRISSAFTAAGVATDPTTITLYIKGPTTGLLQYTYAGGQLVRDGTGAYHYDYTSASSGTFYYRYEAAGAVVAAVEGSFLAGPSFFK